MVGLIERLYQPMCGHDHRSPEMAFKDASKQGESLIESFFKGFLKSSSVPGKLYRETADYLLSGIKGSWNLKYKYNDADHLMLSQLRTNIFAFSGAKSLAQMQEFNLLLTNKDGSRRSFAEFKKEALKVNSKYNLEYLKTEYNTSVNGAQRAAKWIRLQQDKDLYPNLKYRTVGDANVRASHQSLDGITRPIDDAFWKTYYPPNDWNCRCDVIQVGPEGKLTAASAAESLGKNGVKNKLFRKNIALQGKVFDDGHPYFKSSLSANKLKAVENYGLKTLSRVYADPSKLDTRPPGFKNKQDAQKYWKDQSEKLPTGKPDEWTFADVNTGRILLMDKNLLESSSHKLLSAITGVITNASEVYSIYQGGEIITRYLKYYKDEIIVLKASSESKTNTIRVDNINELNRAGAEKLRKGTLEFNSQTNA